MSKTANSETEYIPKYSADRVITEIKGSPFWFDLTNEYVILRKLGADGDIEYDYPITIAYIFWGGKISLPMHIEPEYRNRILWLYELSHEEYAKTGEYAAKGGEKAYLCSYTNNDNHINLIMFHTLEQVLKRFVHLKRRRANYRIKNGQILFSGRLRLYSEKQKDICAEKAELVFDDNNRTAVSLPLKTRKKGVGEKIMHKLALADVISKETEINNPLHLEITVNKTKLTFNIGRKERRIHKTKFYYLPYSAEYTENHAVFIRKNVHGNYTLVIRPKDSPEYDAEFLRLEDKKYSRRQYRLGKIRRVFHKKSVNLFYEKNSIQAQEGTWEVFCRACESENSRNYFILDRHSSDWDRLKNSPQAKNVIAKYSEEYYRLLYESDVFIATETSSHLNVHRAMNYYVRKAFLERPLIFLQHGVTYLKQQGNTSVFGKGKEGEPAYIMVDSDKERDVVCKMLKLEPAQCIKTGLPVFSTIEYEHINETSENIATIMLTWKPSEEHLLTHFVDSSFYKKTEQIYRLLGKRFPESRIQIVPHPKVLDLLKSTDIGARVWHGTVAQALENTKLLITDYSSTCYNAFYQGAAVVFYQPDLESYEAEIGKLIPEDNEYIGFRAFDLNSLEKILDNGVKDGIILLDYLRNQEFKERYRKINEFSDGKNVERIVEFLKEKGMV